ncbi:MAG TPA: sigma-54-dependent transcriptional regulator [Eubacteriaceae bacterium]|jgi:PAS domain S-box-containing protein|nr:sigma-54-dependent transcriptional regulator [Eubacteriaceae bacterium]
MDIIQITNNIQEAIVVVDEDSRIILFNKAAEKLINVPIEEAIDRPIPEIIPNSRLPIVIETGQEELNQRQSFSNKKVISNRFPLYNENNKIIGACEIFNDNTQLKEMSRQITSLQEARYLLEAILDSTQDAISVVDEKGLGVYINPAYTRMTGLTEKDVIGKPATVDIAEGESIHMKVLKTQKPVKNAFLKVGPKGRHVVVDIAPVFIRGKLRGSVGVIHDITDMQNLTRELEQAKQIIRNLEAKYTFDDIIGDHPSLLQSIERAKKVSNTPVSVLLRGESGTGKEIFAHAIHNASNRKNNQFIRVNCASLQESLLNSELFGYVEGAFTGAVKGGKKGLFEEANGGTIFLDEVGEISPNTQAKILRVLQEKEIIPVGGNKPINIDVRVIAATNIDLEKAVEEKTFRKDLYYRLNVYPIHISELKERKSDIPLLCHHLIRKFNQEYGRNVYDISQEAIEALMNHNWPGNVRELENVIGRAMINMKTGEKNIEFRHLPILVTNKKDEINNSSPVLPKGNLSLKDYLEEMEKDYIKALLDKNKNNKTKTAEELNISIRNLYYKLEKYQL